MHVLARTVVFRIRNEHFSIATPKILARRKARQSQCFLLVPKEFTQAAQESLVVLEDSTLATDSTLAKLHQSASYLQPLASEEVIYFESCIL